MELSAGIPFVSDAELDATLEKADVPPATASAIVDENATSRISGLKAALAVLALLALVALAFTRHLPIVQPKDAAVPGEEEADEGGGEGGGGTGSGESTTSARLRPAGG